VALEALRDFMKRRELRARLRGYAEIDRVQTVMRPYLEAIL